MVAVTLIAGVAVFGWVNGQAAVSEKALGQNDAKQANYYQESFVIVSVQFSNTNPSSCQTSGGGTWCNQVSVAIYNNGGVGLTIQSIAFTNSSTTNLKGITVPPLKLLLSLTNAQTGTYAVTQYTCGYTTGPPPPVSETLVSQSQPIAKQTVPPTLFTFSLPSSCGTTSSILDGATYSIQVLGLYGNTVTTQVTANG